jgi:hypothetical protein
MRIAAMKKEPIVLLAFLALGAGAGLLRADDRFLWRSWGVRDGFTESYSFALSMAPLGSAYIRHGAVLTVSAFDGYSVTRIPEPRGNAQHSWDPGNPSPGRSESARSHCGDDREGVGGLP